MEKPNKSQSFYLLVEPWFKAILKREGQITFPFLCFING
jgi:hypothetical protein